MLLLRSLLRPALRARPDAPAPIGLLRAARLTGAVYGTLQLAALFAGFVITVQAEEIGSSDDLVQLIVGLSSAASALVAVCWFLRRTAMPPGWRLAVPVVALGVALVYLGLWPSVGSFTVALVLASGLGPSAMLVRQRIAGQFPGRCQGAFLATCQTWTFLVRALGGLAFALAVYGVLDLPWATVALGGAVLAVAAVYAWWPRLRGHAGRSPDPGRASAPTPLARLLGSPSLRRGLVATVGIYTAFGVFWAELQPRIAGVEGFDDRGAAVVTALLGLTVVASIPRVRRHSRLSDQDSTRSATEASGILLLASAVGILSLIPCVDAALVLLPLFLIYIAGIEIGGNATSSAVTTALTVMDSRGRATLMASLARSLAGVICGAITAVVAWTGGVWAIAVCAVVTWFALRLRQHHPIEDAWIEGSCDPLRIVLAPAEGEAEDRRAEFTVALVSRAGEVGPWPIWRRDTVIAKSPREPHAQSSERIIVFRIAFDWPLVHGRKVRRASGRLYPFVRVPVALDGDRRGYLRWRMWSFGRWSIEDGDLLVHSRGLDAPTQFVHHRHGPI